MNYSKLVEIYASLGATTKRLEKIEILSKFLEYLSEKDKEILYLLNGEIYPTYDERKIGISNQLVIKAISKAYGISSEEVVQEWKKIGDLGEVAKKLISSKKQSVLFSKSHLTTDKVLENLRKLPELEGEGTIEKKLILITDLLASASPLESLYLVRTLIGDLRIGIQESTIRDGLTKAFFNSDKEVAKKIQEAIDNLNDLAEIFMIARKGKISEFEEIETQIGKPMKVMLGPKAESIEQAFEALGRPLAVEYKYDGFRVMIHKNKSEIKIFTRRLENVTKQFPEIKEYIEKYVKGDSFILDGEAVGYDKKTKEYTPFQAISQRIRRKYEIEKMREELPIELNIFDILYYNGKSLSKEIFQKRTEILRKIISPQPYKIIPSKMIIASTEKEVEEFYKKALKDNQEGVFFKRLDSTYKSGRRVGNWLKLKPSDKDLDLVITGAEYGTGKRSGWLSSFILSCKGKENNEFLEIGRVGTGIKEKSQETSYSSSEDVERKEKDEPLAITFDELNNLLKPLIIKEEGKEVKIKPKIVVAITYQEIQKSPNYSSGWALRFPRITALRPDKPLSEIANIKEIERDVERQNRK